MQAIDPRALTAAHNNADLYELVFAAHNKKYTRKAYAFFGLEPPPPYYSNLTTLSSTHTQEQLSKIRILRNSSKTGFTLKDGFRLLDLSSEGFKILFTANWVCLSPTNFPTTTTNTSEWVRIQHAEDLIQWEAAWKSCGSPTKQLMFPNSLLNSDDIAFYAQKTERGIEAGCIANLSKDCVGISNVFAQHDMPTAMLTATQLAVELGGDKPIVGFDNGAELDCMLNIGFEDVGALCVWQTT